MKKPCYLRGVRGDHIPITHNLPRNKFHGLQLKSAKATDYENFIMLKIAFFVVIRYIDCYQLLLIKQG